MKSIRALLLATTVLALGFGFARPAHATNVVPNPGFEQDPCGATPICGWTGGARFGTPGNYYMYVGCGVLGCSGPPDGMAFRVDTDPAFCAAIGPGPHPASFVGASGGADEFDFSANFYRGANCTGPLGSAGFQEDMNTSGHVSGVFTAPAGTQSALFSVGVSTTGDCSDYCAFYATFDDLDVEDTVLPSPAITSFTPAGGLPGAPVDIRGWNFTGATSVDFNGTPATFTVDSTSEIHATVPPGASTGPISVTTPQGTDSSTSSFTVATSPDPVISSFSPTSGLIGTSIDILGWSFAGATAVTFNGTNAAFTVDSDFEIHATAPSGASTGPIAVTTPSGTATSCCFTIPPPPSVQSFTPAIGPPGTSVDIVGENLNDATSVTFNGTAATFTIQSLHHISATVPSGATTGPISVTAPGGTATTSTSYTVDQAPVPRFTFSCTALTCSLDAGASSDPDGTLQSYSWSFGDGSSGTGRTASHTYANMSGYVVTLTVTDDAGLTGTTSATVTLISLTAHASRVRGTERVDLAWTGTAGASFDVHRNGAALATVVGNAYTDTIRANRGSYTYQVCTTDASVCSNTATLNF